MRQVDATKRRALLGIGAVVVGLSTLTGCTTGCTSEPAAQAVGDSPASVVVSSSGCKGPGPKLLNAWDDFIEAVFG